MKLKKLSQRGFSHAFLPALFVVIFAVAGVGYLVASHAATPPVTCTSGLSPTLLAGKCESYLGSVPLPNSNETITAWACVTQLSSTDWQTTAQYLLSNSYKTLNGFNWTAFVVNNGTNPLPNNQYVYQSFTDTAAPYATVNIHSNPQGQNPLSFSYEAGLPVKGGTTVMGNIIQGIHPVSLAPCGVVTNP